MDTNPSPNRRYVPFHHCVVPVDPVSDAVRYGYCPELAVVQCPADVTGKVVLRPVSHISERAFVNCTGITEIVLPESLQYIWDGAFSGCAGLTTITIPSSVKTIYGFTFENCSNLLEVAVSKGNQDYADLKGVLFNKEFTQLLLYPQARKGEYPIPDSVTKIGNHAFSGCVGLTSLEIPDSVTEIGDYAFSDCVGLTSLAIPESIRIIGKYAFSGCTGLTHLAIPESVTRLGNAAFSECTSLAHLFIPDMVLVNSEKNAIEDIRCLLRREIMDIATAPIVTMRDFSRRGKFASHIEDGGIFVDAVESQNVVVTDEAIKNELRMHNGAVGKTRSSILRRIKDLQDTVGRGGSK